MTFDIGPNTLQVLIAIIAIIPAVLAAIYANKASSAANATHNLVNGRMTELLEVTRANAKSAGVSEGVAATAPIIAAVVPTTNSETPPTG